MAAPTLRSLARSLDLSLATVSAALSGSGRVKPATARRVIEAAELAGYRSNPLASAVMSEVRRSGNSTFRGLVAVVDMDEKDRPLASVRYHADIIRGAAERAAVLGFKLETFVAGGEGLPVPRLDAILKARGIRGVVLLPAWNQPDLSCMDWSGFAGVYADYVIETPALHSVYPDQYRAMMMVLRRLRALGYQRPGLFLAPHLDERIQFRWQAAYLAFQANAGAFPFSVPMLKTVGLDSGVFTHWFAQHSPDVVLGHRTEAIEWMEAAGARVPDTHGFVCLNLLMKDRACAGLDLQPFLVGSLAVEQLVALLHRNELGVPPVSSATAVPPRWVDGPTVRMVSPGAQEQRAAAGGTPAVTGFPAAALGDPLSRTG
jgi:LacI family transcriptional regulator